jgi:hypothetical protein
VQAREAQKSQALALAAQLRASRQAAAAEMAARINARLGEAAARRCGAALGAGDAQFGGFTCFTGV